MADHAAAPIPIPTPMDHGSGKAEDLQGGPSDERPLAPPSGDETVAKAVFDSGRASSGSSHVAVDEFVSGVSTRASDCDGVFSGKFSSFPCSVAPSVEAGVVPSLFPSTGNMDSKQVQEGAPSWLSNSSFSENLLPPPLSFSASKVIEHLGGKDFLEEFEKREGSRTALKGSGIESGSETRSSNSESDSSKEHADKPHHKRRKDKRRKKRKKKEDERKRRRERKQSEDERQIGFLEGQAVDRKAAVKTWADGKSSVTKNYYVDTRGDRDNLAFGSLYRMDVARYSRQQVDGGIEIPRKRKSIYLDVPEPDGDGQENRAFRYWSGQSMALETRRDFRRIRIRAQRPSAGEDQNYVQLDNFIPVGPKCVDKNRAEEQEELEEGESWDDYIIRRTRELNTSVRERPEDESTWLEFAKFQDELIHLAQRKGVKQQAVEKKLSVLERALEHHASSVQLTLMYLQTCSLRDTVAEMLAKWEKAVAILSGSYRFWKEFLLFVCSQFSLFSVTTVRTMFIRALGALTAARDRLRSGCEGDVALKNAELAVVAILADRCRFEIQTGHAELGLGIFQAAIEYSLFTPLIQPNENNKRRLFESFWDSQAPRIGEEGALGWALWLEREEEQIQSALACKAAQDEQAPGGWSGWSEPVVLSGDAVKTVIKADTEQNGRDSANDEGVEEEEEEEGSAEGAKADEDEATLLSKLGISSVYAGKELEITDVRLWLRWALEESKRGSEQWLPVHAQIGDDEKQDEQLEKVVMFEDIRDILVSISTAEALCWLIGHFLEFCNISLSNWCSSNELSSQQGIEGLESLTSSLSQLRGIQCVGSFILQYVAGMGKRQKLNAGETILKGLVGDEEWFLQSSDRAQFLCNALLLLQTSSANSLARRHWELTETLLVVQCLSSKTGVKASGALAKKLLKRNRQDIALWAAYAMIEGAAGHIDSARKVFDTTLSSLLALPNELQEDAPFLYLACADMEIFYGSKTRALHVLCQFGAGIPYSLSALTADHPIPPTLILKARSGFQQHLQNVRNARTYVRDAGSVNPVRPVFGGVLDERAVAVISCVALFEELSLGWEAAVSVFEQSLAFTLPGRWKESKECEALMERYISLLRRNIPRAKPAQVRRSAVRGLIEYPYNSVLLEMFVESSPSKYYLRRFFDDSVKRNPSTLLWMFALATELGNERENNAARIRSLFERALEMSATQHSVLLWRTYLAYEFEINHNVESARRVYFRAIHACPWSKKLWLDGFTKLSSVLTAKELAEFQEIMRDKELRIRTDIYEILLQDAEDA